MRSFGQFVNYFQAYIIITLFVAWRAFMDKLIDVSKSSYGAVKDIVNLVHASMNNPSIAKILEEMLVTPYRRVDPFYSKEKTQKEQTTLYFNASFMSVESHVTKVEATTPLALIERNLNAPGRTCDGRTRSSTCTRMIIFKNIVDYEKLKRAIGPSGSLNCKDSSLHDVCINDHVTLLDTKGKLDLHLTLRLPYVYKGPHADIRKALTEGVFINHNNGGLTLDEIYQLRREVHDGSLLHLTLYSSDKPQARLTSRKEVSVIKNDLNHLMNNFINPENHAMINEKRGIAEEMLKTIYGEIQKRMLTVYDRFTSTWLQLQVLSARMLEAKQANQNARNRAAEAAASRNSQRGSNAGIQRGTSSSPKKQKERAANSNSNSDTPNDSAGLTRFVIEFVKSAFRESKWLHSVGLPPADHMEDALAAYTKTTHVGGLPRVTPKTLLTAKAAAYLVLIFHNWRVQDIPGKHKKHRSSLAYTLSNQNAAWLSELSKDEDPCEACLDQDTVNSTCFDDTLRFAFTKLLYRGKTWQKLCRLLLPGVMHANDLARLAKRIKLAQHNAEAYFKIRRDAVAKKELN